jgi:hypothetical protein
MNRLLEIGFQVAGHWTLTGETLACELIRHATQSNILYAFVCDGRVMYVGKTTKPLRQRMSGYRNPGSTQATNLKNHHHLKRLLEAGSSIDILALPDNGLMHYGTFHLNLAAALEDSIIATLKPEWNGRARPAAPDGEDDPVVDPIAPVVPPTDSFEFILHRTYFNTGFFNVPVEHSNSFGEDGAEIEIFCGTAPRPILGTINRRSNANRTPRIFGGIDVRDWFQAHCKVMESVDVLVDSPQSIRLVAHAAVGAATDS